MAKMCKKCGALLKSGTQSCSQCGEPVSNRTTPLEKAPSAVPAPTDAAPKKKLTISEKKERKASKQAKRKKGNRILLIVDLILLLLLLVCAALLLDALGMIDIPFFGSNPERLSLPTKFLI